jgi:hypothetical protein
MEEIKKIAKAAKLQMNRGIIMGMEGRENDEFG